MSGGRIVRPERGNAALLDRDVDQALPSRDPARAQGRVAHDTPDFLAPARPPERTRSMANPTDTRRPAPTRPTPMATVRLSIWLMASSTDVWVRPTKTTPTVERRNV